VDLSTLKEEHKVRNRELYVRVRNLVKEAFFLLNEKIERGEKPFFRTVEYISLADNGKLLVPPLGYRHYHVRPDLPLFIFKYRDELSKLPEWKLVLKSLSRDDVIHKHLRHEIKSPFGEPFFTDEYHLLSRIIWMSVDENSLFHFNSDIFDSVYNEVESYFYSKIVVRKSLCLLLGFDSEVQEIELGHGLRIRNVSKDEILELWRRSNWFRALIEFSPVFRFTPLKYVLELSIETPKIAKDKRIEPKFADPQFQTVLSALRLFKKGWVDYLFTWERVVSSLSATTTYSMKHSKALLSDGRPVGIPYRLSKAEAEDFREYFKRISKKIDYSKIPLKRFNETYQRIDPEDKLVDYMISFESLYLSGEEKSEMAYKLAHRVSLLLHKEEEKRKETFLEMKKAYSLRSQIVHGGKIKSIKIPKLGKEYTVSEFVQKIEKYLRSSIRLFLEKQKHSWIDLMFKK